MKKKLLVILLLLGMVFIANTQQAWAVLLDFNMDAIHPVGVSIVYAGGTAPLVGSNISVDSLINADDISPVILNINDGRLNFTSGAFDYSTSDEWFFKPGGSFTVTGALDLDGDGTLDFPATTELITGTYFAAGVEKSILGGDFKVVIGGFNDVKNEALAQYYGLQSNGYGYGWSGNMNLSFKASSTPGSSFESYRVLSGDIINTPLVPEPASMLLLGMGILGVFGLKRKVV